MVLARGIDQMHGWIAGVQLNTVSWGDFMKNVSKICTYIYLHMSVWDSSSARDMAPVGDRLSACCNKCDDKIRVETSIESNRFFLCTIWSEPIKMNKTQICLYLKTRSSPFVENHRQRLGKKWVLTTCMERLRLELIVKIVPFLIS